MVALHALSEMAAQIYSGNIEQTITLTGKGFRYTITVDSRNARILQTFQVCSTSRRHGPKEIDGLLVPPGRACTLLTDHLITR